MCELTPRKGLGMFEEEGADHNHPLPAWLADASAAGLRPLASALIPWTGLRRLQGSPSLEGGQPLGAGCEEKKGAPTVS